jgi:hypothetical protein
MGIRETLNKNKKVAVAITVSLLALAGGLGYYLNRAGPEEAVAQKTVYFTDDDGKTWFVDEADKLYPFDHNGKTAYRVQLFQCGATGKPEAVYIQRIEEQALKKAEEAKAAGKPRAEIEMIYESKLLVKKPGGTQWVPVRGPAGEAITAAPKCPAGVAPQIVLP